MNAVLKFPVQTATHAVDQLAAVQAQIADLKAIEDSLKDSIKTDACATLRVGQSVEVIGNLFKAVVVEKAGAQSLDSAKLKSKLIELLGDEPSKAFFASATKIAKGTISVTLYSRSEN